MATRLPAWLQDMLDHARAQTEQHGQLPPEQRLALYARLDPMTATPPNIKLVRGTLAIKAAEYVLPHWHNVLPLFEDEPDDDKLPDKMLDMARAVVAGQANLPETWDFANDHSHVTSNVIEEIIEYHDAVADSVAFVTEAALKALLESMGVETLKPIYSLDDARSNSYTDDAASAACIVVAGGGDTNSPVNEQARLDYWRWWLQTALPETWQSVGDG
jgi:hypothetical protein